MAVKKWETPQPRHKDTASRRRKSGEGGIRSVSAFFGCVSYGNHVAVNARNTTVPVMHYPNLPWKASLGSAIVGLPWVTRRVTQKRSQLYLAKRNPSLLTQCGV